MVKPLFLVCGILSCLTPLLEVIILWLTREIKTNKQEKSCTMIEYLQMGRDEINQELPFWKVKMFEILYMPIMIILPAVYVNLMNTHKNLSDWKRRAPGNFVFGCIFFIRNRDFCLLISRLFGLRFYPGLDTLLCVLIFIQAISVLFARGVLFHASYERYKIFEHKVGRVESALFYIFSQTSMDIICIICCFYFKQLFMILSGSFSIVILQNCFLIFFFFHSCMIGVKLKNIKNQIQIFSETCLFASIIIEATFSINYFYIFAQNNFTFSETLQTLLLLASLHLCILTLYNLHQSLFCTPYIPSNYAHIISQIIPIPKESLLFGNPSLIPAHCNFCLNDLDKPSLEYGEGKYLRDAVGGILEDWEGGIYVKGQCEHKFHASCFADLCVNWKRCVICDKNLF
ncbi:unnamed protein product [Moneuplotes crassus]|uniref:Uncharacterized protein n=1 Tax=Euplotes crassus TaxID=5936 RepID=A0AAD1UIR8_EUPCR|nr:unnamed protein product [Moneuplotes crassus]